MKLSEIFSKIGIDLNNDIEMGVPEQIQQQTTPTPEQVVTPPVNQSNSTVEQSIATQYGANSDALSQQVEQSIKLQQAQQEIENLKKMNFALLQQTPISQEENLSIEDRIYMSVIGKPRKE